MELDLRATPTLQLSGPGAAEKITEKLKVEIQRVFEDAQVVATRQALTETEQILDRTNLAWRHLNDRVLEIGKFLKNIAGPFIDQMIQNAADGSKRPDNRICTQVVASESEHRLTMRAIQNIVTDRLPKLEIAKLRCQAEVERAKADAFDRFAEERAQKLITAMGAAIAEEVILPVNTRGSVAGMLIELANEARKTAHTHEDLAKELQDKYDEGQRKQKGF